MQAGAAAPPALLPAWRLTALVKHYILASFRGFRTRRHERNPARKRQRRATAASTRHGTGEGPTIVNLATRMIALFLVLVAACGVLLASVMLGQAYQSRLVQLADDVRVEVARRGSLQVEIYQRDSAALEASLHALLPAGEGAVAAAHDAQGALQASIGADGALPALQVIRGAASPGEVVRRAVSADGEAGEAGFLSAFAGNDVVYFSVPVFTAVDPSRRQLQAEDFVRRALQSGNGASDVVIGYATVGVAAGVLAGATVSAVLPALGIFCLLAILSCGVVVVWSRQISGPLGALRSLAEQIRAGKVPDGDAFRLDGEFRDIAEAIKEVMGGLERRVQEITAGEKMLNMKADQSASQLVDREEELRRATAEISETRDRLHRAAYYDSLTSLPNRALFTEQFRQLLRLRERDQRPLALLLINLRNFRRINESLGHVCGDLVLAGVASRLSQCVRDSDVLAASADAADGRVEVSRLGGDEFALVLNQLDGVEAAGVVAQRLVDSLAEPIQVEQREIVVSVAVGIALAPKDGESVEELLRAAATAAYHGQDGPGKDVVYFNRDMENADTDRFRLEADLRRAREEGQLLLHYQPQVDTFDGSIVGAEALLRWEHPALGLVPPYQFIPLAEEMGLIDELGEWVVWEACRQLSAWRAEGLELPRVAINVSAGEYSAQFNTRLHRVLQETGLSPRSLELGLSEGILADGRPDIDRGLRELADLGVYLSLDGFGTSGAPLACLGQYALDEIKIDRGFVADCDRREGTGRVVKGIVAMAQSLELRLLAEGVESPGEYQFLAASGVRAMQGYLFSRPVSAQELGRQLAEPWYYSSQIQRMALQG
ncbi:MAG: hypothetical protein CME59_03515 [Halioglobus sp.]|nr:hypothetical protein [Halioglobus sp.]